MILVTGATGNVGRHVVAGLSRAGIPVRAVSRRPWHGEPPQNVEVVHADLSVPETLSSALEGVDAVFLVWPQASARDPSAAWEVIGRHARRVVYVSSLTVDDQLEEQTHPMTVVHAQIERMIQRSGVTWSFLRAGKLAANTLGWAPDIRGTGVVRLPHPGAGRSPIHERDLAEVAVRVLTDGGYEGAKLVLTGPEMLTEADLVRTIARASERPVRCEEIDPGVARREMLAEGLSADLVDAALAYWALLVTRPEPVTRSVEEITGSPARTFHAWAADHAAAFR